MRRARVALAFAFPALLLLFLSTGGCGSSYSGNSSTVTPAALNVSSITPPNGQVGSVYTTQSINVSGGTSPYTATATGLPAGLSLTLNSNGSVLTIGGTPTTAQSGVMFTISVTDSSSPRQYTNSSYTISVMPSAVNLSSITPTDGQVGAVYTTQIINVSGGTPPYTHTPIVLPAGLSLTANANGSVLTISGTPTTVQTGVSFTISVTDSSPTPQTVSSPTYTINIISAAPPLLSLFPGALPNGTMGAAYNQTVYVAGGIAPYKFSEPLPLTDGLTAANGAVSVSISGTPSTAQTGLAFSVMVTDSSIPQQTATVKYTIDIGSTAGACFLNGQYAFQSSSAGETYVGSINIASNGSVSGGAVDYKGTGVLLFESNDPITAGSCVNDSTVANTGTVSFTLSRGLQSASDKQRVLHFALRTDETVGFAKLTIPPPGNAKYVAIGQIQHQNNPTNNFFGSYGFGLFGSDPAKDPVNQPGTTRYGIVGALCTNAGHVVTYTHADLDDAYTVSTDVVLSNPLKSVTFSAPDSNGRSVMTQWNFTNGPSLNLILYVVNGDKAFVMEATPPATNPQTLIGTITGVGTSGCRPSSGFFNSSSLTDGNNGKPAAVLDLGGVELVSGSPTFSSKIGVINNVTAGAAGMGTASLTEDVDRGSTSSPTLSAPVTYTISPAGRGVINYMDAQSNQQQVIAYFDGTAGGAYLLQESNAAGTTNVTEVGTLQPQVAGPFSVTSIGGTYALLSPFEAQAPLFTPTVEKVTIDNTLLSFTATGALPSASASPYLVDAATGRGTVTMKDGTLGGNSLIFYIVSPTKLVLTAAPNQDPVLESLEQ